MSKVQQLISMDEADCASIGQLWLDALAKEVDPTQLPGEIKVEHAGDTSVTTMWLRNRPRAIMIRQRCQFNCCVMTLIEVDRT